MFFTRSIRRKLFTALVIVAGMLCALSVSSISGLWAFRELVRELDFTIDKVPRRAELVAAMSELAEPLLMDLPESAAVANHQQREFQQELARARAHVAEFHRKFNNLPPEPGVESRRAATIPLLHQMNARLDGLARKQAELSDPLKRPFVWQDLLQDVVRLQLLAQKIPDPQNDLSAPLRHARAVYHSRFVWVGGSTVAVVLAFAALLAGGYRLVVVPIRRLQQGAARVAQGDFDYRINLPARDEMGELAEAFNQMTARFADIRGHLDQQICERSRQLVRSERLAGIGFLAAGVAHEINNPLNAVVMAATSLKERLPELFAEGNSADRELVSQYLDMIEKESFRCREITTRMLDFARGDKAPRSKHCLTQLVSEVLAMIKHLGRYKDRTIVFPRTAGCCVEVNGGEIKQVILNLVANALEATEPGGEVRIEFVEHTDHVDLVITDNGAGMTREVLDHLFEPFFTQRKSGKGTGLGLSITQRIIADHGGTIEAVSDGPGQGSQFRVHLPRAADAQEAAA